MTKLPRLAARLALYLIALAALASCATSGSQAGDEIRALVASHPDVFRFESYAFDPNRSVVDRIQSMPDFVLAYLEELDDRSYVRYQPTQSELDLFAAYFNELPPRMRRVMDSRVVGIYFLEEEFIGGGFTEFVLSGDGEVYTFLVFNRRVFDLSHSEWVTYRENTVFGVSGCAECDLQRTTITAVSEDEYLGLMHILLHEGAHVVDYVEGITPYLQGSLAHVGWGGESPDDAFLRGVWVGFATTDQRYEFPRRRKIAYYGLHGGPYLDYGEAHEVYASLLETPFVSLYAATTAIEDLAELVAWHHLTNELGQQNTIKVVRPDGQEHVFTFTADPVTPERREIIASFYR